MHFLHDHRSIQPIFLGNFVSYFAQTDDNNQITSTEAYCNAFGIILSAAFFALIFSPFVLYMCETSYKIRVAYSGLIYRKALQISKSSTENGRNGIIINLLSNDLAKFHDGLSYIFDAWRGPFEAVFFFIIIYMEIGNAAIVGYAFLASFIPLKGTNTKFSAWSTTDFQKQWDWFI